MNKSFAFFIRVLNEKKEGFTDSVILEPIIKEIVRNYKIQLLKASDYNQTGRVSSQIFAALENADIIFADANSNNENVWLEIGYAFKTSPLKIIFLMKEGRIPPFDVGDYRKFYYNIKNISDGEFINSLNKAVKTILETTILDKLLKDEYYQTSVREYILSKEELQKPLIESLEQTSVNIEISPEIRARAVSVLLDIQRKDIDTKLLEQLSNPITSEPIRIALYDKIADSQIKLNDKFWLNGIKGNYIQSILRNASRSAALHYTQKTLEEEFFIKNFVYHKEWIVRKHITINLLKHVNGYTIKPLNILCMESRDEITNRFIEWFDNDIRNLDAINNSQKQLLKNIIKNWKDFTRDELKQKVKEIKKYLNKHKKGEK
jgi:hypothetical protein